MLLALLWPDPCDPHCPAEFKTEAANQLRRVPGCNPGTTDEELRKALLRFIADFANWDRSADSTYLEVSRALVHAAHESPDGGAYDPPLVVDPFAGGGSIPLEALRVGCDVLASDLNPVACLILRIMLEDIARYGPDLANELRTVAERVKEQMTDTLGDLYPRGASDATPLAYLWARTILCEAPNCGAEIPLLRSYWLSRKGSRLRALDPTIVQGETGGPPEIALRIYEPKQASDVPPGPVSRARATCPACRHTMPADRVRAQLATQRGGAEAQIDDAGRRAAGCRLIAVVIEQRDRTRDYREPDDDDYVAVDRARQRLADGLSEAGPIAQESLPAPEGRSEATAEAYFNFLPCHIYGLETWSDLFTTRQQLALTTLVQVCRQVASPRTRHLLGAVLGRCADYWSAGAMWAQEGEFVAHTFGRHALPVILDFAETNPLGGASGSLDSAIDWVLRVIEASVTSPGSGQVESADARRSPLPDRSASVWFTDPPYYDAVPYSYLSNFFLVWLKRLLHEDFDQGRFGQLGDGLAPSDAEIIDTLGLLRGANRRTAAANGLRLKDKKHFEDAMQEAFAEGNRVLRDDGVGAVVFAHKTTEGWEALLSGMIRSGWTITASWPLATERPGRLRSQNSAALATSVHLVCRRRPDDAPVGDWAAVIGELPKRVGDWMERLQDEGVRGADLVFACIGPALEIFSRYVTVEAADGREIKLDEYLEKVWEVVGREALARVLGTDEAKARNGAAGAVEEDARLSALFLWTLQSTDPNGDAGASADGEEEDAIDAEDAHDGENTRGTSKGFTLAFDVVRRFAQPLGIDLPKWEGRVIDIEKGVVRLLPLRERAKQLFGADGAEAVAAKLEQQGTGPASLQGVLFPDMEPTARASGSTGRGRRARIDVSDSDLAASFEATTLDRVHAAMLLQASGRTNALRSLIKGEQERGSDFIRLSNALSALYPNGSEEKRLIDAMLLAVPR